MSYELLKKVQVASCEYHIRATVSDGASDGD